MNEIDPEVDDRLGDLRPDPADNTLRTHQAGSRNGLDQVLSDKGVHGRNPRNI